MTRIERTVFLSHSSKDKADIQRLSKALADRGIGAGTCCHCRRSGEGRRWNCSRACCGRRGRSRPRSEIRTIRQQSRLWAVAEDVRGMMGELEKRYPDQRERSLIASVQLSLARLPEGITLALRTQQCDRAGEAQTLYQLGSLYDNQGRLEDAAALYRQAIDLHHMPGNRLGESASLNNLGIVFRKLHRFDEAREVFAAALALRKL
jgi:tetratricopeptide (TPR) repeat protein